MNFHTFCCSFLLMYTLSVIEKSGCEASKSTNLESSFLKRKTTLLQQNDRNSFKNKKINRRHTRKDKPLHLAVHRQKHISGSKSGRSRRQNESDFGSAIYFDGSGQLLKLRFITKQGRIVLPDETFTVQFWAKPEGGQGRYTPIIDLLDDCKKYDPDSRWTVGIHTDNHERRNANFMFTLLAEESAQTSILSAHKRYDPNVWTNIAASFDGKTMKLYINGAKISNGHEQKGRIYSQSIAKCKALILGGNAIESSFYRGYIDEIRLWNRALDHEEVVQSMRSKVQDMDTDSSTLIMEQFEDLSQWRSASGTNPDIIESDIPLVTHNIRLEAPACGQTVCDDPEAVRSYLNNAQLQSKKTVRYRVINFLNDDGSDPLVSTKQLQTQNSALNEAFMPYNIEFLPDVLNIKNSSLRQRLVMFDCFPHMIGDGHCDPECGHSSTGNDAGDCDIVRTECFLDLLGNGKCDSECNKVYYGYDSGDCCLPGPDTHLQCIDPDSQLRAYINVNELKESLRLDGSSQINIFFITASWQENTFRGLATYPWEKNMYTSAGGIIMHYKTFGKPGKLKALVHEMGHNLGLWHVHHGISEMNCENECAELHPSMVHGDLCSDTNPTPRNHHCRDPQPDPLLDFEDTCGVYSFQNTPYDNYMSYADDDCTNHFTPQQVARMHCYLDLVYQPIRQMKTQVPVPIAPKVIAADDTSVLLVWLEPLGLDPSCDADDAFHQYADTAMSSHNGVRWSPQEATGFPDSERCRPTQAAWMPHYENGPSTCEAGECWLELGFKTTVIPRRLSIWVADIDDVVILSVGLVLADASEVSLGTVPAYCDIEVTLMIESEEEINKIRIYTSDKNVAIDAVELVSVPRFQECTKRKQPKYKVVREPPFSEDSVVTGDTEYKDRDVVNGQRYSYRIQTLMDSKTSELSPSLDYVHGQAFCGDGIVDSSEECDDRNVLDGDGCSIQCRIEDNFHCKGSPSLCYMYAGDGVCEDFEREMSPSDCGFFTPDGFVDQWVSSAVGSAEFQTSECPESALIGPPSQLQKCEVYSDSNTWRPCGESHDTYGNFWIEVYIPRAVVAVSVIIHLGADGYTPVNTETKYMHVDLITPENQTVPVEPRTIPVSCWENPIHVPLNQDLSKPFMLTKENASDNTATRNSTEMNILDIIYSFLGKGDSMDCKIPFLYREQTREKGVRIRFTYSSISIAGVRIRSSPFIDPIKLSSCKKEELYNVRSGQCTEQSCSKSLCGPFLVKYGVADCSGLEEGDTCSIICDTGYEVSGHKNEAVCVQGSWITSSSLICTPVDCHRPKIPHATVACSDGTTYGGECIFKCDRPAQLFGNDTRLRCQDNGRWSEQQAFCEVRCDTLRLDADNNGKLKTLACAEKEQEVGQPCKIRCNEGYHVEGERIKKRSLTLLCDEDGQWSGPVCIQNQCPPVPDLFTGAYTCSNYLYRRSTCIMSCPGSLETLQTIKCKINGDWSGRFTVCPSLMFESCPSLASNSEIDVRCKSGNTVGDRCDVSCADLGYVPIYKRSHDDPHGTKPITYVENVVCSVMLTWMPKPDRLICVKRCFEEAIGDGFCDADNNQEHCDWDGGDCCPSTVEDGVVITFPEHCPVDCKCRDPAAAENKRRRRRHKLKYKALMYGAGTQTVP